MCQGGRMRVTAIITLQKSFCVNGLEWNTELCGKPVLLHVVDNCLGCPVVDDVVVATDLTDVHTLDGLVKVASLPHNMERHTFNFLDASLGTVSMQTYYAREIGYEGDVIGFFPWNMPLLSSWSMERLYHFLLEDMVAGRTVPIYPVDPGLHTRLPGEERVFPVWHAPGVDRQRVPQLYRPASACFSHQGRIFSGIPLIRGVELPVHEQVVVDSRECLDMAEFILNR